MPILLQIELTWIKKSSPFFSTPTLIDRYCNSFPVDARAVITSNGCPITGEQVMIFFSWH